MFACRNPSIGGNEWTPFEPNKVNYLHITTAKDEMKDGLLSDRLTFWKNTFELPKAGGSKKSSSSKRVLCLPLLLLFHFFIS